MIEARVRLRKHVDQTIDAVSRITENPADTPLMSTCPKEFTHGLCQDPLLCSVIFDVKDVIFRGSAGSLKYGSSVSRLAWHIKNEILRSKAGAPNSFMELSSSLLPATDVVQALLMKQFKRPVNSVARAHCWPRRLPTDYFCYPVRVEDCHAG